MSCASDDCRRWLSRGESMGLLVTAEASILSLVALCYVFILISRNVIRNPSREQLRVFHRPMDLLMFSLFIADTLQGIGGVAILKWIRDGKVEVGDFCTVQGVMRIMGATGVSLTSLAIAIWTFCGLWMPAENEITSMIITMVVLIALWLFIGVMMIIGVTTNTNYFAPDPYWCSIHNRWVWKLFSEYLWMWIALFVSLVVYIPLLLWMRGYIVIHNPQWWKISLGSANNLDPNVMAHRRHSLWMAAYPCTYALCVLPLSVVRWIHPSHEIKYFTSRLAAATLAANSIFNLSGFLNVVLLLTTRPDAGLFGRPRPPIPLP